MLSDIIHFLTDPRLIISTLGTFGVIAIIFLETGAFFGFFFPGDSLLFTAGLLASQGLISFPIIVIAVPLAAIIGDSVGYAFGKKIGPALFVREDSFLFKKHYVTSAQKFYEKYGKKTIILARFIPVVRTFAPIIAGVGNMEYKTFLSYNIIGGVVWTWATLWLGYGFGSVIPDPDRYILPAVIVIIILSSLPPVVEILRNRNKV